MSTRVSSFSNPGGSALDPNPSSGAVAARLTRAPKRLALANLPTPVERAAWLDGERTRVWIKRDDQSSTVYGGGKVRKLEWILANAPHDDEAPILSVGGVGSHHLLALALHLGTQHRALHALTFETPLTESVRRNLTVLLSLGTTLWHVKTRVRLPWAVLAYHTFARPSQSGHYLAAGASTALGCLGFVEAAFELSDQIDRGELPKPDCIYVAGGSAGTAAGLAVGLALARVSTHLHVVSSVERWAFNRFLLSRKIASVYRFLLQCGLQENEPRAEGLLGARGVTFSIDHGELGGGYGVPTEASRQAVELAGTHDLFAETTYTGKCLAALRRNSNAHLLQSRPEHAVLFWNTHASNDLRPRIDPEWMARCPRPLRRSLEQAGTVAGLST